MADRNFRLLFAGRTVSYFGTYLAPIAVAFAILDLHGSATAVGLSFAAWTLAQVSMLVFGGVIGDRFPRRLVMIGSDVSSTTVRTVMGMLLVTGHAQVWELVALQGFGGASVAFYNPAFYGLVRELVPPEGMQKANSYLAIARYAAFPLGAATGGSIVATVGAGTALLFDGGTYAVSALLLSFVRVESLARAGSSIVHELREGWQAFTESAWLWRMTLWISLYFMITYAPFFVLGPYIAEHSMPAAALAGFGFACGSVVFDTAMQPSIPPDKLARVGAYSWMSAMVFLPAGYTLAGPIASAVGMRAYLLFGAAWLVASTLVVYRQPAVRGFSYEEQAPEQDPLPAPS